jgi:hypothetical protein
MAMIYRNNVTADFPEQRDWVLVHVAGGYGRCGITVRVSVPRGHGPDEMLVESSDGTGWVDVPTRTRKDY